MPDLPAIDPALRDRLALAIDVDDLVVATRLARELAPWFGVAKVGLELYSAAGPDAVTTMVELGFDVFLDLKLHDIPTTVGRAARVLGGLGAAYVNMHAAGGESMLRAGADGLREGAASAGVAAPVPLAVTVLTSDRDAGVERLRERARLAVASGCGGVVCAAADIDTIRDIGPDLITVVPGVRLPGSDRNDQERAATPGDALRAGASLLVIGRTVTAADDRSAAAEAVVRSLGEAAPAPAG